MNLIVRKWIIFIELLVLIILLTEAMCLGIDDTDEGLRGFQTERFSEQTNSFNVINWPDQRGIIFSLDKVCSAQYIRLALSANDDYQIQFVHGKKKNSFVINSGAWATITDQEGNKPILHLIPNYISSKGYEKIIITPLSGDGTYGVSIVQLLNSQEVNQYKSDNIIDFEIKQMEIDIDEDDYKKIEEKRKEALDLGNLLTDDSDIVTAKIKANSTSYKAELRLKGDWVEHLMEDKWSFRIDVKGNQCIYGLQKFSIQPPETRNGIWEYLIYEMYREQGGVALRYDFTDVYVNGVYKGVYAIEEFMEKRVIENSKKREGPIIKISEDLLWERRAYFDGDNETSDLLLGNFEVFSEKKTVLSANLSGYASYAITQINKVLNRTATVEEVFDIDFYARLHAILDLFGSTHGRIWHNMRNYYNPVTGVLEPIPFDEIAFYENVLLVNTTDPITSILFTDQKHNQLYKKYLVEFSNDYPSFIDRYMEKIKQFETTIKRDNEEYSIDPSRVDNRIELINIMLNSKDPYFIISYDNQNNVYKLNIKNINVINVSINKIFKDNVEINQYFNQYFPLIITSGGEANLSIPVDKVKDLNNLSMKYETKLTTEKTINAQIQKSDSNLANNDNILSLPEKDNIQEMYNGMIVDAINGRILEEQGKIKVLESDTEISLYGWAADFNAKLPASALYVKVGDKIYKTKYGISRTSVSDYYKDPKLENTGFEITLPKNILTEKKISFITISNDGSYRFKEITYTLQ